jgi:hypothetical protein
MPSIRQDVQEILEACGYVIAQASTAQFIEASRESGEERETMFVWVPDVTNPGRARTDVLHGLVASAAKEAKRRIVLLPKLLTLSAQFQSEVGKAGGRVRSYAHFYDAPFVGPRSDDESDDADLGLARSDRREVSGEYSREQLNYDLLDRDTLEAIARKLTLRRLEAERSEALRLRSETGQEDRPRVRAPQPYFKRNGLAPPTQTVPDTDLFRHLTLLMNQEPTGPEVHLIIGSAGGGKSIAFSALYTYLYEVFMKRKEAQSEGARPIPVMPESLLRAETYSTVALFKAVAETEVAAALDPRLLDKFVRDGRAVLMIDGLDEFFADQDDFFDEIAGRYLAEASSARIVIALRDSLLSSSPNVEKLIGSLTGHPHCTLRTFQLAPWEDSESKRALAWLRLEGRLPLPGERDTAVVGQFLRQLESRPVMTRLAQLPFWCNELIKDYEAGFGRPNGATEDGAGLPDDEYELLERALARLIEREWNKHRETKQGRVVPETAFVPGLKGAILAFERIVLNWQTWAPTSAIDSMITGVPRDPTDRPTVREVLESRYAADGHAALRELLEEAAWRYRRLRDRDVPQGKHSLDRGTLNALYSKRRSWATGRDDRIKGERILRHFALFGQGERGGVDFAHDYMADYLAARYAVTKISAAPNSFCDVLGTATLGETEVFVGYLKRELAGRPALVSAIRGSLRSEHSKGPCADYAAKVLE